MDNNIIMKVGFLKPETTTVDTGNHFSYIENLIEYFSNEEFNISIYCNKWILSKMLELKGRWNDDAKQIYALLHKQLSENLKSNSFE